MLYSFYRIPYVPTCCYRYKQYESMGSANVNMNYVVGRICVVQKNFAPDFTRHAHCAVSIWTSSV